MLTFRLFFFPNRCKIRYPASFQAVQAILRMSDMNALFIAVYPLVPHVTQPVAEAETVAAGTCSKCVIPRTPPDLWLEQPVA